MNRPSVRDLELLIVSKLVTTLLDAGLEISIEDGGDEDVVPRSQVLAEILEGVFSVPDCELYAYDPNILSDANWTYWVRIVFGNDGWDVLADYTTSLEPLLGEINELIKQNER